MTPGNGNQSNEPATEHWNQAASVPLPGRRSLYLFFAIAVLFIAARLWRLTGSCLWFDEIFSVHASRHSWTSLLHFVAADIIHPPLFYVLLKVWTSIGGESLLWLRLFPAVTSVLTIIPFVLLCRELRLKRGELNLAFLLLAVNGYLIKYGQELRMYSLLLFFALCSLWLFVKFVNTRTNTKRQLLALFAVNLLLVYTHYSGWLLLLLQALVLVVWQRRKLRHFLSGFALLVLAYVPWLYAIVLAAEPGRGIGQNIGWVMRPGVRELAEYLLLLNRPFLFSQSNVDAVSRPWALGLVLMLFGIPLLAFCRQIFKANTAEESGRTQIARWLLVFTFAPVVLAFIASWLMPYSIWGTRHLIIAAGPYAILAALALKDLKRDWMRIGVFVLLACWFVFSGLLFTLRRPPAYIWCTWEELAQELMIAESKPPGTVRVYTHEDLIAYHLWFALDSSRNPKFKVVLVTGDPEVPNDPAYFLPRDFADISTQANSVPAETHVWVAFRAQQWDEASAPLESWLEKGYRANRIFSAKAQGQQAYLVELNRGEIMEPSPPTNR